MTAPLTAEALAKVLAATLDGHVGCRLDSEHRAHVATEQAEALLTSGVLNQCDHDFVARSTMGDPYESCDKCGTTRDLPLPGDETDPTAALRATLTALADEWEADCPGEAGKHRSCKGARLRAALGGVTTSAGSSSDPSSFAGDNSNGGE